MTESYRTIRGAAEASFEVQKSRFIAQLRHAESEEAARAFLQQIKKKRFDARHNCSAWVLGAKGAQRKSNDDGEPGGTAGLPILEAIRKKGLTDLVIVVTRYFGGIKLGAGGLARAYGHAAVLGMDAADLVDMAPFARTRIAAGYEMLSAVEGWIRRKGIRLEDASYAEDAAWTVLLPLEEEESLRTELTDKTSARCDIRRIGQAMVAIPVEKDLK